MITVVILIRKMDYTKSTGIFANKLFCLSDEQACAHVRECTFVSARSCVRVHKVMSVQVHVCL